MHISLIKMTFCDYCFYAGGAVYARRMREKKYITMLDPIQHTFGQVATVLVYMASLLGDLLWTAAILSALGACW